MIPSISTQVMNSLGHSVARIEVMDTREITVSMGVNAMQNTVISVDEAKRLIRALEFAVGHAATPVHC